jgi:hypothetical protein
MRGETATDRPISLRPPFCPRNNCRTLPAWLFAADLAGYPCLVLPVGERSFEIANTVRYTEPSQRVIELTIIIA